MINSGNCPILINKGIGVSTVGYSWDLESDTFNVTNPDVLAVCTKCQMVKCYYDLKKGEKRAFAKQYILQKS